MPAFAHACTRTSTQVQPCTDTPAYTKRLDSERTYASKTSLLRVETISHAASASMASSWGRDSVRSPARGVAALGAKVTAGRNGREGGERGKCMG